MSSEGPTTTGSIDAKLTIDKSQWDAKVEEAKAEARELGDLHPDVKVSADAAPALAKMDEVLATVRRIETAGTDGSLSVKVDAKVTEALAKIDSVTAAAGKLDTPRVIPVDANVGPAVAKIDSVAVAEQRLDVATRQAANSASTAYVASQRLEAMQGKRGATELQLLAATEALARADRNAEASELKVLAATEGLNKARAEAARKALEEAAANEVEAKSAKTAGDANNFAAASNNRRVSGLQVLIALAPALLGPAAAIAASAVGLGVAFGVMGVAGALAFKGIKDEMHAGTTVGAEYMVGLGELKGNLDGLGNTSAVAMLKGFDQSLSTIEEKMPFLNGLVGNMSAVLGQMGGNVISSVLTGLQQMNTLINAGAIELSKFVSWLFSFSGTNGFSQFIQYAMDNLPGTMKLIENLITLAGHILAAFAPLGPVVLGFLNGLTDVLNALPLPVLAGFVTTVLSVAPAVNIAGAAVKTFGWEIQLFGIEANLAVPVIGIFLAIVAGVGMAVAASAASTQQGTQAFQDYTQALKDDNEVLGQHVQLQAAKALSDAGAYEAANQLGISQKTLTDALLGNADAQNTVNAALQKGREFQNDWSQGVVDANTGIYQATQAQDDMGHAIDVVTGALNSQRSSIDRSKQINQDIAAATDTTTGALTGQAVALQIQARQFGTTTDAIKNAQDAQDKTGQSTADTTLKMQLQNDAAGLLKMALDGLNGKAISAAQAQNAFDSQLANMGTHVDKVGKNIQFTTTNIGDMSAASVALRGQLNGQVQALQGVVEANGGLENSTGAAREQMVTMRQQIIDNAVAHGVDKDAVTAYIDKIMQIPASVPPTKVDVDNANAMAKIQVFQSAINSLTGKTVQIYAQANIDDAMAALDTLHANSMVTANAYATGSAYSKSDGGTIPGYKAGGGPVSYLAAGGFPGGPRGTDTVPTWLTPNEFVVKRASAQSIGLPALNYMNQTGQLPPRAAASSGSGVFEGNLYLDSGEFLGRVRGIAKQEAAAAVDGAGRSIGRGASV